MIILKSRQGIKQCAATDVQCHHFVVSQFCFPHFFPLWLNLCLHSTVPLFFSNFHSLQFCPALSSFMKCENIVIIFEFSNLTWLKGLRPINSSIYLYIDVLQLNINLKFKLSNVDFVRFVCKTLNQP